MVTELLVLLSLVAVNGLFSGAEIAIVAVPGARLETLAEAGSRAARTVLRLRGTPERLFATIQVVITVVTASAATLGGVSIAARVAPLLATVAWAAPWATEVALTAVVAAVSFLSIVLGELVPKSLALRYAERYALAVGGLVLALSSLARPVVWLLTTSSNLVLKPFGDSTTFTETRHSADELQRLLEDATRAGTLDPSAGEIAARALELPELTAEHVMIPRNELVAVNKSATPEEVARVLREHPYVRLPVTDDGTRALIGFVSAAELLTHAWAGVRDPIARALRDAPFVPESQRAVDVLRDMRRNRVHVAFVVDERGSVTGMVTLEDLLEELVGDLFAGQIQHVPQFIKKQPDGSALVSGSAPVRDVNRVLAIELPEDGSWNTVAGLSAALAGRIPSVGEVLRTPGGDLLEVVDATPRRVRALRVRPAPKPG
ncbi:MAG: HlyC/CorC family transporter [Myxococcus sp.]|nr:HlyC/CorC family transporter [Myxococcus sp.]